MHNYKYINYNYYIKIWKLILYYNIIISRFFNSKGCGAVHLIIQKRLRKLLKGKFQLVYFIPEQLV